MQAHPSVTVMIATRDRSFDLQRTLELIRAQQYPDLEILVIDDGSIDPVEPVVLRIFPDAKVIRHQEGARQCKRRNEGFAASKGEFILQLDDDCCFTQPGDLARAVDYLTERPTAAAVVFDLFN